MFSYLQNIRPNSRRNAPSPIAPPLDTFHGQHMHSFASHNEYQHSPQFQRQPVERPQNNPYVLPLIPRVASQTESTHSPKETETTEVGLGSGSEVEQNGNPQKTRADPDNTMDFNSNFQTPTGSRPSSRPNHDGNTTANSRAQQRPTPADQLMAAQTFRRRAFRSNTEPMPPPSRPTPHPAESPLPPLYQAPPQYAPIPLTVSTITNPARQSKTKLNLLNPMSLLARRRSAQAASQAESASRKAPRELRLPDDYDPRIRGNKIHDFSAPRPKPAQSADRRGFQPGRKPRIAASTHQANGDQLYDQQSSPRDIDLSSHEHTPVFKEHFEVEQELWQYDEDDRRNQQTRQIMSQIPEMPPPDRAAPSLPPFARNLPGDISSNMQIRDAGFSYTPKPPLEAVSEHASADSPPPIKSTVTSPPTSPPQARSRASSTADLSFQSTPNNPKRLASNASRFSFDMGGVGSSAQEKLLEEKHRQHAAAKKLQNSQSRGSPGSDHGSLEEEDDYYDDMDDADGLEEMIPGVNADAEDETFPGFDYSEESPEDDRSPTAPTFMVDNVGETVPNLSGSFYNLQNQPLQSTGISSVPTTNNLLTPQLMPLSQPPPVNLGIPHNQPQKPESIPTDGAAEVANDYEEDDLYFDDGVIDDLDRAEASDFDESVFDDENSRIYGVPLRDLKPLPVTKDAVSTADTSQESTRPISVDSEAPSHAHPPVLYNKAELPDLKIEMPRMPRRTGSYTTLPPPPVSQQDGPTPITHSNLSAYHDALAKAAMKAALEGKFERKLSNTSSSQRNPSFETTSPRKTRVSFDDDPLSRSHHSPQNPQPTYYEDGEDDQVNAAPHDDSPCYMDDELLEDDPIIAAANAEALENDDEGFYGREFGFYANSSRSSTSDLQTYANGGWFGLAGEGLRRSHSGRADFQEPNLTPITERSEWSTRNSAILSPAMSGFMAGGVAGGVEAGPVFDESTMSLEALMKLRRGAWGGSQGSGAPSPGAASSWGKGSPLSAFAPLNAATGVSPVGASPGSHAAYGGEVVGLAGSVGSLDPIEDEGEEEENGLEGYEDELEEPIPERGDGIPAEEEESEPTLHVQTQGIVRPSSIGAHIPALSPTFSTLSDKDAPAAASPKRRNAVKESRTSGHSRNSSGNSTSMPSAAAVGLMSPTQAGETVCYVKEGGEGGAEGRWVLEKRRVGVGGGVEVLRRVVIEGGI